MTITTAYHVTHIIIKVGRYKCTYTRVNVLKVIFCDKDSLCIVNGGNKLFAYGYNIRYTT